MRVKWKEPFYVGIGACAHDKDSVVEVEFEHIRVDSGAHVPSQTRRRNDTARSKPYPFPSGDRRAVYATPGTLRGPTWERSGTSIIASADGRPERIPIASGKAVEPIGIGNADPPCESFQGVSPDGKRLAISCGVRPSVYIVRLDGVRPLWKRITHKIPTYFHGWSPDGKWLLYSIERKPGKRDFDRMPAAGGGKETRLTNNGTSDNPEYSPDGKFIYFNSDRGVNGTVQIWRMTAAGTNPPEQITSDGFNNWYPHVSPDGRTDSGAIVRQERERSA